MGHDGQVEGKGHEGREVLEDGSQDLVEEAVLADGIFESLDDGRQLRDQDGGRHEDNAHEEQEGKKQV